ncbi:hypothetical protein [Lysobacter gummosus]|uniref:hypothetical protein n=1 Tax=Lysobacter gummosus TaxID=262324 RepID=UPI003643B230
MAAGAVAGRRAGWVRGAALKARNEFRGVRSEWGEPAFTRSSLLRTRSRLHQPCCSSASFECRMP